MVELSLEYRPPLDWESLVAFLAARATPGVEYVEGGRYVSTVRIGRSGAGTLGASTLGAGALGAGPLACRARFEPAQRRRLSHRPRRTW